MNTPIGLRVSALRLAVLPAWLCSSAVLCAKPPAAPVPQPVARHAVVPEKELLITDRAVTESAEAQYPGPLSFGYVMEQLAGTATDAPEFTREWLRLWLSDQEVNRDTAPSREKMLDILEQWRRKDGVEDPFSWQPNLGNAPFKLIAVVNRMDLLAPVLVERMRAARESALRSLAIAQGELLAPVTPLPNKEFTELGEVFHRTSRELEAPRFSMGNCPLPGSSVVEPSAFRTEFVTLPASAEGGSFGGYGSFAPPSSQLADTPSGEGRLVFALTGEDGRPVEPGFTVIFEYALNAPRMENGNPLPPDKATMSWAANWHRLGTHKTFDDDYLRDLVAVTRGFTDAIPQSGQPRPLPPPLAQVRTNDGVLEDVREFREFRLVRGRDASPASVEELDIFASTHEPHRLRQVPVGQTPAERYLAPENSGTLTMVLKSRIENFRKEAPVNLPASIRTAENVEPQGILGARALLAGNPLDFTWKVNGFREKGLVRHFSLHTCNGCHGGDTSCDTGCHVKGGADSTLISTFLAPNAQGRPSSEMQDRAAILKALLEAGDRSSDMKLTRLLHRRHRGTH